MPTPEQPVEPAADSQAMPAGEPVASPPGGGRLYAAWLRHAKDAAAGVDEDDPT